MSLLTRNIPPLFQVGRCVVRLDVDRATEADEAASRAEQLRASLLRRLLGGVAASDAPTAAPANGQGSGFILSVQKVTDSVTDEEPLQTVHIVTNAHVVAGARSVRVALPDGRAALATLVGADAVTDVALLSVQLEPPYVTAAPLGDSDDVQTGDWAVALGCPFGLDASVTLGIVSSTARSAADVGIADRRIRFLQTDAPINPGSSGGPLVNEFAEVVGMSTAIRADSEGIGFALPINSVRAVAAALVAGNHMEHPYIGVAMASHVMRGEGGVRVASVLAGGPACEAGLQPGDTILAVDGDALTSPKQLSNAVHAARVGQALTLDVLRAEEGPRPLTLAVLVGELADAAQTARAGAPQPHAAGGYRQL